MKRFPILPTVLTVLVMAGPAGADEGMWPPHQLPQMADRLKELGLRIAPETLSDLTGHPMNAVISLGGCTASFVSPDGLVITNHHCAMGALQYNSTQEVNLMEDGFLAAGRSAEVFAGPGSRVLVTVLFDEVTGQVQDAAGNLTGRDRYKAIEAKQKELIKACEEDEGHRCRVSSFYGGLQYYLVKQLEIRDVRLVYAPAGPVGNFGGDIDNWMWPRHNGDYSFYRAYVGTDGKPADFSPNNVPYKPKHYLKVTDQGIRVGDYVMVTGYPGNTRRHLLADEVRSTFEWSYPQRKERFQRMLGVIEAETRDRPGAAIKYAGMVQGINNAMKNTEGMLAGYAKSDIVEHKASIEEELLAWIAADESRKAKYGSTLKELLALIEDARSHRERDVFYDRGVRGSQMLGTASLLYHLAREKQKPDAERLPGFQERDMRRLKESLERLDKRFDAQVDRALWLSSFEDYVAIPAEEHVAEFDAWFGIEGHEIDLDAVERKATEMYELTGLDDAAKRLEWLEADASAFEASQDPFLQLAVRLYDSDQKFREEDEERSGRSDELRPKYMEALIAYLKTQGQAIYPDANSTLRVTFGQVKGYSPKDGVTYTPFTTLDGILQKDTGEDPFNSPPKLLETIRAGRFGHYAEAKLGTVPVDFLSDLDITGGNSGSPTLNGKGELVGLAFDNNWESIISDWDFLPEVTRTIHVDVRYVLWVMDFVDEADYLIEEMGLTPDDGTIKTPPLGK